MGLSAQRNLGQANYTAPIDLNSDHRYLGLLGITLKSFSSKCPEKLFSEVEGVSPSLSGYQCNRKLNLARVGADKDDFLSHLPPRKVRCH